MIAIFHCNVMVPASSSLEVGIGADNTTINRGTYLTFRRYYFISRLEKTMKLLLKIQSAQRHPLRALRSDSFDISLFHDKRIIRSLKRIEELRNLKPLFMIWDDFVAYKSLEDDIFIEDFSKEIFVVTRKVLSSLNDYAVTHPSLHEFASVPPNKTELLLDAIDEITHALQQVVPPQRTQLHSQSAHQHAPPLDLKAEVTTDEIALRFYYIQRLQKAMELLSKVSHNQAYHTIDHHADLKSPGIIALLRAMQDSNSANPVMHQWDDVKEYKFIDNMRFVREFVSVVLITLRHVYTSPNGSLFDGSHIERMTIDQILHAIDIITDQVSNSSQVYANTNNGETIQEWLQQYWWVIPITVGSIAVRLAYYYYYSMQKPHGYYGGNSFGGSFGGGSFGAPHQAGTVHTNNNQSHAFGASHQTGTVHTNNNQSHAFF